MIYFLFVLFFIDEYCAAPNVPMYKTPPIAIRKSYTNEQKSSLLRLMQYMNDSQERVSPDDPGDVALPGRMKFPKEKIQHEKRD